jgi:hypothetical protein
MPNVTYKSILPSVVMLSGLMLSAWRHTYKSASPSDIYMKGALRHFQCLGLVTSVPMRTTTTSKRRCSEKRKTPTQLRSRRKRQRRRRRLQSSRRQKTTTSRPSLRAQLRKSDQVSMSQSSPLATRQRKLKCLSIPRVFLGKP